VVASSTASAGLFESLGRPSLTHLPPCPWSPPDTPSSIVNALSTRLGTLFPHEDRGRQRQGAVTRRTLRDVRSPLPLYTALRRLVAL
jgi:hypothetical protein